MKDRLALLFLFLILFSLSTFSQNLSGDAANRFLSGSEMVRIEKGSAIPSFVRLKESAQFPSSNFPAWAKKAFKLESGIEFILIRDEDDKFGFQHHRYQITKNGIAIFGAFAFAHGTNNMVASVNGRIPATISNSTVSLSENTALQSAKNHIKADSYKWELPGEENHLKWETEDPAATYFPKGELVYIDPTFEFTKSDAFRLAYKFDIYAHQPVYRAEVLVDAQTGEVLFENHRIHIADANGTAETGYSGPQNIVTDSFNGGFRLREAGRGNGVRTFDMNEGTNYGNAVDFTDGDNNWNNANGNLDQYATDAHWGAEMTYDYFLSEHGRNSIDNNNMQINSYIHYDQNYFNAFWDGQRMSYGDGNGNPLTALDICGHEMAHGVTENSAGLIYQDEYGALNESFSDIFGAAVEFIANPSSGDWLMGEDVGTLRSMSNPNQFGDPDTYEGTNWVTGAADNGGVHSNSGVQNKWFYILVEGENAINDNGDTYNVTGIGLSDAQAIAYRNLTVYLGQTSEYDDARFYAIQSAIDLFGGCSPQVIACTDAWYAVGIGDAFDPTVNAGFSAGISVSCEAPFTVEFENSSSNGSSYSWDFGDGETSTGVNPSHTYASAGNYTVTLNVDGDNCGTDTETVVDFVSIDSNNPCTALMPTNGSQTLSWCTGTLYDSGGPNGNYTDNTDVTTTISPVGATSVTLNFSSFGYEETYDYVYIYDGPTTNSPLIGQYDGFGLPNGGTIISTGGSITIKQTSDVFVSESGFVLTWECQQPNSPPTPDFIGGPRISCNGLVSFSDLSINGPTNWLWGFGDGNTSTDQNPTHTYPTEGTYTVTLTAGNNFGSNVISRNNYITVDRPDGPAASNGFRCDSGSVDLSASGAGTMQWYNLATGGSVLNSGSTFSTPSISATTTYYVEDAILPAPYNVGPNDNTFGDGGNFQGDQYLVFDCLDAFTINTVKVYAQGGGNRTIELRDDAGNVLQTTTVNIPDGEQIVTLNFAVQPGTDYQLGTTPGPDLFRNNDSPAYPYTVPNVVSITSSSAGNDFFYFFYNWQITTPGCTSERTAVVANIASSPTVQGATRCGEGSVTLTAAGSSDLNWYDAASNGNLVNTGTSFSTPSISTSTSYFVESEIAIATQFGGPTDNNFGTGSEFNNTQSLLFDCYEQATLLSVKVYAFAAGNRTVELRDAGGTVLQSATINISDGESRIDLNFELPIGTDLQLGTAAAPALYRNNAGPNYPYDIPSVLSITSSTAGNDFYYFFYDWEVQREGCSTARTVVVATINPNPTVSVTGETAICEGESVSFTASTTNTDSYLWSPGGETTPNISASPTSQTIYSVTVSNSCGNANDEITVDINPLPTVSISGDNDVCEGESISLSANTTDADGYLWSGGETTANIAVSPTSESTYSVTVSNACGDATDEQTVEVNPLPSVTASNDMDICEGESVTLSATSDDALIWEPGEITANEISVSPSNTTTYTVTASNNCGDASEDVIVEVNELPNQPEITVGGSDLVSSVATDYQWYLNGQPISGANGMAYNPMATGDYSVEITDENGCTSVSENYSWIAVGVGELDFRMDVYPVPFSTNLKIESEKIIKSIQVVEFTGRTILDKQFNMYVISLETEAWANGVYFLKMELNDQQITRRVVKSE